MMLLICGDSICKIFRGAKTALKLSLGRACIYKKSVRTDGQIYAKDFCGDDGIILFLGITGSLAFRTIIAYSNHIPHEFSTSMSWSSRHSTII